jgi:hypothetical protein
MRNEVFFGKSLVHVVHANAKKIFETFVSVVKAFNRANVPYDELQCWE